MIDWFTSASPELDLRGRTDVGLLPVGAVEQHGPHLPTGTDTIVASALCRAAGEQSGAVVLPAIPVGVSFGHGTRMAGTLSVSPEVLISTVREWLTWAAESGLRRVLLVNAHFGNSAALSVATDHVRLNRPDLRVGVVDWWSCTPSVMQEMTQDGGDVHANRAETSLMLAVAPELVRLDRARDADDPDRTSELVFRYTADSLSVAGVTGRPSEATAELGERLREQVVSELVRRVRAGRTEEPPLAAMQSGPQ